MKPPKSEWPYILSEDEYNSVLESIVLLWHYDILTDGQHDQAVSRLEKMYCYRGQKDDK